VTAISSTSYVAEAARLLRQAQATRIPIDPLTETYPGEFDVAAAWQIQSLNRELALAEGRVALGYKVGLTSHAMQEQMGVSEPDFGVLLDDMIIPDGATIHLGDFVQPRVEAEIALVLRRDLGAGASAEDVLESLAAALPAIEIIDSRIKQWRLSLVDTIADNASSGAYVLGPTMPLDGTDLAEIEVSMRINDATVASGNGAAALGHPAAAAAWLADRLAQFGLGLPAGAVVLTGSLHASLPIALNDRVTADFGRFGAVQIDVQA
jgi:2-keto-4-pentenoate hydratase